MSTEDFAPHPLSRRVKGSHAPSSSEQIKPPQTSIQERFAPNPMSSDSSTKPGAGPKVPENAPAGRSPGIKENNSNPTERFAPHALSSGKGSSVIHMNPPAQSQKKTQKAPGTATSRHSPSSARLPPQPSIPEGYGMDPISSVSSGTEPRAGPKVPENAPAGSSPGTGSTSDNQTFTAKGHRIKEK